MLAWQLAWPVHSPNWRTDHAITSHAGRSNQENVAASCVVESRDSAGGWGLPAECAAR